MGFSARILADSLAPCGKRLTTIEATYPRPIHSELLTHRLLSKSSASSRAIPVERLIQRIIDDPWVPMYIGANQKGMQAGAELPEDERRHAVTEWSYTARDNAVASARYLASIGVHKQVVNRLLEPWMWITVLISATEWDNFFGLRLHKDAEPHFQHIARLMKDAMDGSTPRKLAVGEWHLPLIDLEDRAAVWTWITGRPMPDSWSDVRRAFSAHISSRAVDTMLDTFEEALVKISVGRCARVSYLTHDGKRDLAEDQKLHDRLMVQQPLHASPAEHVAKALDFPEWFKRNRPPGRETLADFQLFYHEWDSNSAASADNPIELQMLARMLRQMQSGNFMGFRQYRKMLPNEHIGGRMP